MTVLLQQASQVPWWGIIVPSIILLTAIGVTWMLYRHFANQ